MDKTINFLVNKLNLKENETVVLASSGGPDSMALFDVLLKIRQDIKINIICAHVNHNLREESEQEAVFLKDVCKANDVTFEMMKIEKYHDDNFHNDARNIRYTFFHKIVEKYNAKYLMTAHHGDDLIETVLMRLVRGASFNGYKGFDVINDRDNYQIVKPLIFYTKEEIREYNDRNNIKYVTDKSNFSDKYTRNRYRKYILPVLKQENKEVHKKFLKYSNLLNMCEKHISKEVNQLYGIIFDNDKIIISKFQECDDIIQYEILNKWLHMIYDNEIHLINDTHVENIIKIMNSFKKNISINLPNNINLYREYDELKYNKPSNKEILYKEKLEDGLIIETGVFNYLDSTEINDNSICLLQSDDITLPLYVRNRKIGDRIILKKVLGHQKVKDIFIDKKIPLNKRNKWPIVVDSNDNIIWIPNIKKSKFCVKKDEKYDIIIKYNERGGNYE